MPVVFFGHGNPMNALGNNSYTAAWQAIGRALPKPRAILAISAHWFIRGTKVTAMASPRTIHDFGGFPKALFEFTYPAKGAPPLAERVRDLLAPIEVELDQRWGLDHGTWSVLAHVFPDADIPVVQLSIDETQPAAFHYALAKKLAPLRDEGVFIMGSGNVVHNLESALWTPGPTPYDWAERFDATIRRHIMERNHTPLVEYERLGADAALAAPTPEHYLPLLYTIALQEDGAAVAFPVGGIDMGAISMLSVVIS